MEPPKEEVRRKPAFEHESGEPWEDIEVPPWFDELVVICIDASASMSEDNDAETPGVSKTVEVLNQVFNAKDNLMATLAGGTNRRAYHVAFIAFDNEATVVARPAPLVDPTTDLVAYLADVDLAPYFSYGDGTAIGKALLLAGDITDGWLSNPEVNGQRGKDKRFATIIIVSDGGENRSSDPKGKAAVIKANYSGQPLHLGDSIVRERVTIACAAYGDKADKELLKDVSSGPDFFDTPKSGKQLRDFLLKSITALRESPKQGSESAVDETQPIA